MAAPINILSENVGSYKLIRLFLFSFFHLIITKFRGNIRHQVRRDYMDSNSILYQLMDIRMNSIMNEITNRDKEYQEISRSSDEYPADWMPCTCHGKSGCSLTVTSASRTLSAPGMGCLPTCSAFQTVWSCFSEVSRFQI